ncbi:MAG TPA: glycosyltransferase [Bacteroidia bacterium]|nr:glycosyltransferase [Bacteroidia bacterium]
MSLISVVVPLYNAADHVKHTIQSVVDQTYQNWELIIVNDGSTDNSVEAIQPFLKDSRIKIVTQANAGVSAARNKGAENAKGDILAFLDSDDLWHREYLQKKYDKLVTSDSRYGMVLSYIQEVDEQLNKTSKYYYLSDKNVFLDTISFTPDQTTCPSNFFITKAAFMLTGGFSLELSNAADRMFLIEASLKTDFLIVKEPLMFYKIHPDNMHKNVSLMVADNKRLFKNADKLGLFDSASERNACYAKMYKIGAFAYLKNLNIPLGIYYLFRAFFNSPTELFRLIINKTSVRKQVFRVLTKIGLLRLLMFFNRASGKVPILVFHRVAIERDPFWPPLKPHEFEAIIKKISNYYRFINTDELLSGSAKQLKKACLVMFDDGYLDFYSYALPIIKKYNVPVTMFLSANNTLAQDAIWTQQIDAAVLNTNKKRISIKIRQVDYTFELSSLPRKSASSGQIRNLLINLHPEEFNEALSFIKRELEYDPASVASLMNYDQINQIKDTVSFQSHSFTHKFLPSLSEDELKEELERSKMVIENKINQQVNYIAYPIGGWNQLVAKVAKRFYKAAFAVDNEMVKVGKLRDGEYLYHIPRFNMHYSNPKEVLMRINGFHRLLGK